MKHFRKKRWVALALVVVVIVLFANSSWLGKLIYPIPYLSDIKKSAEEYGLDPYLIAAIMRVESSYKPERMSRKGAIGLMQIMPDTGQWMYEKSGQDPSKLDLYNAQQNIEVGVQYVDYLYQQFNQSMIMVLAAYNAGEGNVRKWLDQQIWDGESSTTDRIPFKETRNYVQSVTYYYNKYTSIYGGS